jgi:hypothetical protein
MAECPAAGHASEIRPDTGQGRLWRFFVLGVELLFRVFPKISTEVSAGYFVRSFAPFAGTLRDAARHALSAKVEL